MVTRKKKFWLWTGSILGLIILSILTAALILSAKWKPLLTEKIKKAVYNGSHHLYSINFDEINLNLVTGSLALHNVTLTPDTTIYESLKVAHNKVPKRPDTVKNDSTLYQKTSKTLK